MSRPGGVSQSRRKGEKIVVDEKANVAMSVDETRDTSRGRSRRASGQSHATSAERKQGKGDGAR